MLTCKASSSLKEVLCFFPCWGMQWQKPNTAPFRSWVIGWVRELTAAHHWLSCCVQSKRVKVVQGELFVPNGKQGLLVVFEQNNSEKRRQSEVTMLVGGVRPLLLIMFPAVWCGVCSSPCCFHTSHPMAFHRVSFVPSCSKAQVSSSAGAKPRGLTPQYVGQPGNPGLRLSSGSCCHLLPSLFLATDRFSSNVSVQAYLKSSRLPSALAYYFWGLKIHNLLNHFSLFRQSFFICQKPCQVCLHSKLVRIEKFKCFNQSKRDVSVLC